MTPDETEHARAPNFGNEGDVVPRGHVANDEQVSDDEQVFQRFLLYTRRAPPKMGVKVIRVF